MLFSLSYSCSQFCVAVLSKFCREVFSSFNFKFSARVFFSIDEACFTSCWIGSTTAYGQHFSRFLHSSFSCGCVHYSISLRAFKHRLRSCNSLLYARVPSKDVLTSPSPTSPSGLLLRFVDSGHSTDSFKRGLKTSSLFIFVHIPNSKCGLHVNQWRMLLLVLLLHLRLTPADRPIRWCLVPLGRIPLTFHICRRWAYRLACLPESIISE